MTLIFEYLCNKKFEPSDLPNSIEHLKFGSDYDKSLENV